MIQINVLPRYTNFEKLTHFQAAQEALKELKSLTQFFFADFEEEDKKRMCEEDCLKEREQKVILIFL